MVECITLGGNKKLIEKGDLILRPAAFGLIFHEEKILLLRMRHTGKFHLPGGGIEVGESIEETLKREVREECGIEIAVECFAHFEELFFYYDPSGRAYHGLHFYYICHPQSIDLLSDDQVCDGSAEKPRWMEIANLHARDFQSQGERIIELCRKIYSISGSNASTKGRGSAS